MRIRSYAISDVGLGRINNEDAFALMPKEQAFLIADGIGGHNAGEIASHETIAQLCDFIRKQNVNTDNWPEVLMQGIKNTNEIVFDLSRKDPSKQGMGTTLCMALFHENTLIHANVGDSRLYRIRKNRLTQLSHDHSLINDLIAKGELDERLALTFPKKNVITKAIGTEVNVAPDITSSEIEEGDLYLLCTDGLTDSLSDAQIFDIIHDSDHLEGAAKELVLQAKKNGGNDNITLILLQINE